VPGFLRKFFIGLVRKTGGDRRLLSPPQKWEH